jgi:hypothetical protein
MSPVEDARFSFASTGSESELDGVKLADFLSMGFPVSALHTVSRILPIILRRFSFDTPSVSIFLNTFKRAGNLPV